MLMLVREFWSSIKTDPGLRLSLFLNTLKKIYIKKKTILPQHGSYLVFSMQFKPYYYSGYGSHVQLILIRNMKDKTKREI